jgi:hypothetical protein
MRVGRGVRTIRAWWLLAAFLSGFALAMWAEDMILTWRENRLEFSAPRLHFLAGKPLERLRNAAPVPFDFQVTLWSGNRSHIFQRNAARFVVSYDLWEEKFSVSKLGNPRKSAAHLLAPAAEAWCLQQMPMEVAGLGSTEPFWVRLEIRAQDGRESEPLFGRGNLSESGISLNGLVEIFSRPAKQDQPHWTIEAGPLTLDAVRRRGG